MSKGFENKHILLAENDKGLQTIIRLMLKEAGFNVTVCENCPDTLFEINKDNVNIDLLILDLQTQELGGDELLATLSHIPIQFPIIVLTENSDEEHESTNDKIYRLAKPFTPQSFMKKINHLIKV